MGLRINYTPAPLMACSNDRLTRLGGVIFFLSVRSYPGLKVAVEEFFVGFNLGCRWHPCRLSRCMARCVLVANLRYQLVNVGRLGGIALAVKGKPRRSIKFSLHLFALLLYIFLGRVVARQHQVL